MLVTRAKLEETKTFIIEHVRRNKYTSFAELEEVLEENDLVENYDEAYYILHPTFQNIIFWSTKNYLITKAVPELIEEEKLIAQWSPELEYMMNIGLLLPRVRKLKHYVTPHWLPVVFSINNRKVPTLIRCIDTLTIKEMSSLSSKTDFEIYN